MAEDPPDLDTVPHRPRLTPWALLAITLVGLAIVYLQALAFGMSSASPGRAARFMRDFEGPIFAAIFLSIIWNGGLAIGSFFRPTPRWATRTGLFLAAGPPLLYILLVAVSQLV